MIVGRVKENIESRAYDLDSDKVIIRECKKEDLEEISNIVTRNLLEINAKDYGEEMMKEHAKSFSKDNIADTLKNRDMVYVALKKGKVIGTAGIEESWSKEPGVYYILTVFIKPENHGQGIGRKLIDKIEEYAKNINVKKLIVPASITGNEFYYKLGYSYKDNKKDLNEEKMYIMEKIL